MSRRSLGLRRPAGAVGAWLCLALAGCAGVPAPPPSTPPGPFAHLSATGVAQPAVPGGSPFAPIVSAVPAAPSPALDRPAVAPPAGAASPLAGTCPPSAAAIEPVKADHDRSAQRDRGFLWRLSRGGRDSYLYGTLHLGKAGWVVPGPTVQAAFDATDLLALEIDPHDPETARRLDGVGRDGWAGATAAAAPARRLSPSRLEIQGRGPALLPTAAPAGGSAGGLPAELLQRLQRQVQAACLSPAELAALPVLRQLMALSVLSARWDGLDPGFSQELALSTLSRQQRRAVVALESVDQQRRLLQRAETEPEAVLAERLLLQLETGAVRRVLARIGQVWEQGDLRALEDYERWCDCAATEGERLLLRELNEERNAAMAERIDALHRGGSRVFAAVGSMHMVGPQGLPQLLRSRGYRVDRLAVTAR